jgi:hypothetical protein
MTGLRRLCLSHPVDEHRQPLSAAGARGLLSAVQHLTQLQHLELLHCFFDNAQLRENGCQCFSALTASTQLTALALLDSFQPVPWEGFQHMFPAGRVLPHLNFMDLSRVMTYNELPACVEEAQVAMIAASCPALQELTLSHVTATGLDKSCLLQLPRGVTQVKGLGWVRPAP